ncbi:DMT family transporter [Kibdelosporangium philippinense]|uniref:DMT family transporter n=1 Tax=Kibdelosporangium philippinense TaxID=211113 RepID=A0ABS8Z490_9PSEU|nr:DMT family transporter [Kibdelosporangium philippinense]MCE7002729.1 DMT family transporter [Kibdelosporangium philippinense]
MTFWLVAAVAGAPLVALGAALQQNAATHCCKSLGFLQLLGQLVRRPKWVLGSATTLGGAVMHIIALSNGPLTIVQPLGMSGLPIAVLIAAAIDRRRVRAAEMFGTFAVSAGLVSLLLLLPHESARPTLDGGSAAVLCGTTLAIILGAAVMARRSTGAVNALFLAIASGVAYGVFAALTRVGGSSALNDMSASVFWVIGLAVVFCALGLMFQQNAYRTGRFALSYATLLVADPITGSLIGVIVLNEQLPTSFLANVGVLAACVVTVAGVVVLSRLRQHVPAAPTPPPTRELVTV